MSQEANNEVGAAGPSGDFEIREDLGRGVMPVEPDLTGNTVDGGSSAAQLPQKNILERKEVLIGTYRPVTCALFSRLSSCVPVCNVNRLVVSP